jgi:hypothetical protein
MKRCPLEYGSTEKIYLGSYENEIDAEILVLPVSLYWFASFKINQ